MSVIKVVLELDSEDPYDAQVLKVLRESPEGAKKELVISAILFWVRSPSFRLSDKIDELLSALTSGCFQTAPVPQDQEATTGVGSFIRVSSPVVALPSSELLPTTDVPASKPPDPVRLVLEVAKHNDGADDIFNSLAETFQ